MLVSRRPSGPGLFRFPAKRAVRGLTASGSPTDLLCRATSLVIENSPDDPFGMVNRETGCFVDGPVLLRNLGLQEA